MTKPFVLPPLKEFVRHAMAFYDASARLGQVAMTREDALLHAKADWQRLSSEDPATQAAHIASRVEDTMPTILAMKDELDQAIAARKRGPAAYLAWIEAKKSKMAQINQQAKQLADQAGRDVASATGQAQQEGEPHGRPTKHPRSKTRRPARGARGARRRK